MPTPAQEAFAEGFSELAEVCATAWTFGAEEFEGVASVLKPDDPRMIGSADRLLEIQVSTAELPSPAPVRGDELVRSSRYYRVTRIDRDEATGLTTMIVTEGGAILE